MLLWIIYSQWKIKAIKKLLKISIKSKIFSLLINRLKCCYVNDPTQTWEENDQQIKNEFLASGNIQPSQNTTQFINANNNNRSGPLPITYDNGNDSEIYQEDQDPNLR